MSSVSLLFLQYKIVTLCSGKTSAQLDGIEAETEQSGLPEQTQEQLTAEDVQLKTIIDASGVSHICSARMTTFAPTRSSIGLTVGVLKLEVTPPPPLPSLSLLTSPRPSAPAVVLPSPSGCPPSSVPAATTAATASELSAASAATLSRLVCPAT
jgi:hypothetical protein